MITGKIVSINKERGFGFITSPERRFVRFFFHWSALDPTVKFESLAKGDQVTFEEHENERGARANKIKVIKDGSITTS